MKKALIVLFVGCLLLAILSACSSSGDACSSCGSTVSDSDFTYCPYCGKRMSEPQTEEEERVETQTVEKESAETIIPDSEKILGTWRYQDSSWGIFEYVFYSDGFCKGSYIGKYKNGVYDKVGGVYPALFPLWCDQGNGDGHWSFVDNKLKVEYIGRNTGTLYYSYHFSEFDRELTIEVQNSRGAIGTVVWEKVN